MQKIFNVKISETMESYHEIDAESEEEALETAKGRYEYDEIGPVEEFSEKRAAFKMIGNEKELLPRYDDGREVHQYMGISHTDYEQFSTHGKMFLATLLLKDVYSHNFHDIDDAQQILVGNALHYTTQAEKAERGRIIDERQQERIAQPKQPDKKLSFAQRMREEAKNDRGR